MTSLLRLFSNNVAIIYKNNFFGDELSGFLIYNIIEAMLGLVLGWLLTLIIMSKPQILRSLASDNVWFKLFTGLLLKDEVRAKVSAILVDVLCETKETTIIYSGFLEKFDLNENKQIEYITLTTATRRDLREGAQITDVQGVKTSVYLNNNSPIVAIPGKYFTIMGSKILNVNVTYMHYGNKPDPNDPDKTTKGWVVLH